MEDYRKKWLESEELAAFVSAYRNRKSRAEIKELGKACLERYAVEYYRHKRAPTVSNFLRALAASWRSIMVRLAVLVLTLGVGCPSWLVIGVCLWAVIRSLVTVAGEFGYFVGFGNSQFEASSNGDDDSPDGENDGFLEKLLMEMEAAEAASGQPPQDDS
ncbi:hypothetical protein FQN54_006013 [Arachnomyces sp. PD_36]|nr:hypothetical protein FQN54_006013 [Arachnomyces sp. PD_36]